MKGLFFWVFLLGVGGLGAAEQGKVLFETYCGACHGNDGRGANDGQFPPLAGSGWVAGEPERAIQVVLHGLQGPVKVEGPDGELRDYDLVMPPQGGVLSDDQLAAILTYVRSAWGNEAGAVAAAQVAAVREQGKKDPGMWQSADLLALYPIPGQATKKEENGRIEHLISRVYHGEFKSLADLRKAKEAAVEEEQKSLLDIGLVGKRKDLFGIVWEGELVVPEDGDYEFALWSDDGSAVLIDGKEVVKIDRIGFSKEFTWGSVSL
ncbi:MAG: c-type cytochrome, partial [Verrucomicrobiales bacterium]